MYTMTVCIDCGKEARFPQHIGRCTECYIKAMKEKRSDMSDNKSKAEELREEYAENVEEMDDMAETMLTIAEQMIDKHGQQVGEVLGKAIKVYIKPIMEEMYSEELAKKKAQAQVAYIEEMYSLLSDKKIKDDQYTKYGRSEILTLIAASMSK